MNRGGGVPSAETALAAYQTHGRASSCNDEQRSASHDSIYIYTWNQDPGGIELQRVTEIPTSWVQRQAKHFGFEPLRPGF